MALEDSYCLLLNTLKPKTLSNQLRLSPLNTNWMGFFFCCFLTWLLNRTLLHDSLTIFLKQGFCSTSATPWRKISRIPPETSSHCLHCTVRLRSLATGIKTVYICTKLCQVVSETHWHSCILYPSHPATESKYS